MRVRSEKIIHFIDARVAKQVAEDGFEENNLVHSERFQVYKLPIWVVKTEIVGIALAPGWSCKTGFVPHKNTEERHEKQACGHFLRSGLPVGRFRAAFRAPRLRGL
jgi:hypothetical protein